MEVVPREDHPHGLRVKNGGYRKLFVSDELDRLYGEYLWRLCDAGADTLVGDLDSWWVFVNLAREPRLAPLRAETVAWQVRRLRRRFPEELPAGFTPHWLRHTHATALLMSGIAEHVVSLTEQRALEKIITVLKQPELTEHPDQTVRGPGTTARAANHPATDQS